MNRLSGIFSKSEKAKVCARCRAMCGSLKGLQALVSLEGYEHYNLRDLKYHSNQGCSMCFKILEALEENEIEDQPTNPGWLNFFALDAERNRITSGPFVAKNTVPPEADRLRYLEAEGPKKCDVLIFMICSTKGELGSRGEPHFSVTNKFISSRVLSRLSTHVV
jgi:hypothetical protein